MAVKIPVQGASGLTLSVHLEGANHLAGCTVECRMIVAELAESAFTFIKTFAVAVYPLAQLATVIATNDGFVELLRALAVNVGDQATAPVTASSLSRRRFTAGVSL